MANTLALSNKTRSHNRSYRPWHFCLIRSLWCDRVLLLKASVFAMGPFHQDARSTKMPVPPRCPFHQDARSSHRVKQL
ncbi:MAG: hypothetical protein F6K44_21390 [Moorea sp. SIO3E2]|nr:hypothetical protein [Moorena sp. SIO3E2]